MAIRKYPLNITSTPMHMSQQVDSYRLGQPLANDALTFLSEKRTLPVFLKCTKFSHLSPFVYTGMWVNTI